MTPSPYRIIQISDLHLPAVAGASYRGIDVEAQLQRVLAVIASRGASDHLLLTGDNIHGGDEAAYVRLMAVLDRVGIPWSWIPGNHDDGALMARVRPLPTQRCQPPGWQCLLLDSTATPDGKGAGSLSQHSLAQLAAAVASRIPALVVMHHNPLPTHSRWQDAIMLQNRDSFWALVGDLAPGSVVLYGHLHQVWDMTWRGVRVLSCPSTAVQFKPSLDHLALETHGAAALPGFRWLELWPDGRLRCGIERVDLA